MQSAKANDETGFSAPHEGDDFCKQVVDFLKPAVEYSVGEDLPNLKCMKYSLFKQCGTNLKIKVQSEEASKKFNRMLHLHVFVPLEGKPQLNHIERGRVESDSLSTPYDDRLYGFRRGAVWNLYQ